ncbi:hypothetical protein [Piscinibacter sp.]|jgi:hypothetical protein|uniref:hypothetical protein n=1 Tax=Piscinibacter sp. TaxID=1903157 RepID=UPI002F42DD42
MNLQIDAPRLQHGAALTARSNDDAPLRLWLGVALLASFLLTQRAPPSQRVPMPPSASAVAPTVPPVAAAAPSHGVRHASFGHERASRDTRLVANWAVDSGDNHRMPFLIVDKRNAKLFVFDSDGQLRGAAPVLLGLTRGDDSVPGIGERKLADVKPSERTTPAGRFVAEPGRNMQGEDIVWIDYDSAVSMHRVRANNPKEQRLQRLATPSAADNRISYGCINVPAAFYDAFVSPIFSNAQGVVYVLPETRPARQVFALYDIDKASRRPRVALASSDH